MNPFQAIPAAVRKWLYLAYGLAGVVLGSISAYALAVDVPAPSWVKGANAVLLIVGTALGFTAAANTVPVVAATSEKSPTGEAAGADSTLATGTPTVTLPADPSKWGDSASPDDAPEGYSQGV